MGVDLPPPPSVAASYISQSKHVASSSGRSKSGGSVKSQGDKELDTSKDKSQKPKTINAKTAEVRTVYADDSAANAPFKYMVSRFSILSPGPPSSSACYSGLLRYCWF